MSNQVDSPESSNIPSQENKTEEPIKPRISIIKQWKILMKSIEDKTGINGYYVIGLLLVCVILVYLNIFESLITNLIGTVYPGFCTLKSIETKSKDKKNWLTYWLIFGSFLIVDKFAVIIMKIIPFYFVLKILFLIWMFLPGSNGSAIVYNLLLKRIFKYLETNVEPYMTEAKTFASTVSVDVGKKISGSILKLKNLKKDKKGKGDMAEALKASQELQSQENQVFQSAIVFGNNPILNNDDNSKDDNLKEEEEKKKKEELKRKQEEEEKKKQEELKRKKEEEEQKRKQEEELKRKQEEEEKRKQEEEELKRKQEEEFKRKQEEEEKRKKEEEELKRKQEEELKRKQEEEAKQKQEEEEKKKKDEDEIAKLEEMQKNISEMTKLVENNINNLDNTDSKEDGQKKDEQKNEEQTNNEIPVEKKEEDKKENSSEEKIKNEWDGILGGEILGNDENQEENKQEEKKEPNEEKTNEENNNNENNEEEKNNGE